MANNGFLIGDSCTSDITLYLKAFCQSTHGCSRIQYYWTPTHSVFQYQSTISNNWPVISRPEYNCEVNNSNLPLTETQQIEAINALFPSAVAILAIAWGFKYIRVLVAEWLKERNASD